MKVVRVGVTPVKGARHPALDVVELDGDGAVGDRVFCLGDPVEGRVLRTVQHPGLPAVLARWDGSSLEVTLPSGEQAAGAPGDAGESVTCDYWGRRVVARLQDGPHAALLSTHLGLPVRLAAVPRGDVIYGGAVSVVGTASLRELSRGLGPAARDLDPARFRATVVVDAGETPFVEEEWIGRELVLGTARVRVAERIPRCAVIDLHPTAGGSDLPVLRTLGRLRPPGTPAALCLGVDAVVTAPGVVRVGDAVSLV